MNHPLTTQEQFFYDNASYSHDPKTQTEDEGHIESAKRHALAETWLGQSGHMFETHHDSDADGSFIDDKDERNAFLERAWYAVIRDGETDEVLASLGGCDGNQNYKRIVRAELALEIMPKDWSI